MKLRISFSVDRLSTVILLLFFTVLSRSVNAQWANVENISVNGNVLQSTSSYSGSQHAMTPDKLNKEVGGIFEVQVQGGSSYYKRYFGLSEQSSDPSNHASMYIKVMYEQRGSNSLKVHVAGTEVYSTSDAPDDPQISFQFTNGELWVVVNSIIIFRSFDISTYPNDLVGHIKLARQDDQVEAILMPNIPDSHSEPCNCHAIGGLPDNPTYWMNAVRLNVDGDKISSSSYNTSHGMTSEPIDTQTGGSYTVDILSADYQSIYIGLTDNTSSSNSSNTMDFKFKYESSFNNVRAYVGNSSVYSGGSIPELSEFKFLIGNDKIQFILNSQVVHTYSGVLPDNLYLHVIFPWDNESAEVIVQNNPVPDNPMWEQNDETVYYSGVVGVNTNSPNLNYNLDVNGAIKSENGNSIEWNEAHSERGSQIAGIGLEWSANQLNVVSNSGNWDAAYTERGSVIGGTGLSWTGAQLNFDGNLVNGNGIGWSSNSFFVQGDQLAGMGLNWDSSNDKFTIDGAQFEGLGLGWDGSSLFLQGDEVEGHGIGWVSSQFVIDGAALAGAGLGWDGNKFNVSASSPWTSGAGLISYATGKVGIGTTDVGADYIMAVDGEMEVEEITVQVIGVPDYVFHDDYDLRPLAEVKEYINQNSHLPEIPSAAELEETGMSLGEMNLLLLKKIEELTLHVIELNSSRELKNAKIDQLENRLEALEESHKK